MPTKIEKDVVTGQDTTGHEWDGLKELNTPLPKWWLYVFYATIAWAVGMVRAVSVGARYAPVISMACWAIRSAQRSMPMCAPSPSSAPAAMDKISDAVVRRHP